MKVSPVLTYAGMELMNSSIGGSTITFTKFQVGDGTQTATDLKSVTSLARFVNALSGIQITKIDTTTAGQVSFWGEFSSSSVPETFRWRELGLFAMGEGNSAFSGDGVTVEFTITEKPVRINKVIVDGNEVAISSYVQATGVVTLMSAPAVGSGNVVIYYPSGEEKLYSYAYDGSDTADTVVPATSSVSTQYNVCIAILVNDASNITAIINTDVSNYVTKEEFDEHVTDYDNPHGVTKYDVGLGNVENISFDDYKPEFEETETNQQLTVGDDVPTLFGKLAKVVKSAISHFANTSNPHNVTVKQLEEAYGHKLSVVGHTHAASDITSGVIPTTRGGTGGSYANFEELKSAMSYKATNVLCRFRGGRSKAGIFTFVDDSSTYIQTGGHDIPSLYSAKPFNIYLDFKPSVQSIKAVLFTAFVIEYTVEEETETMGYILDYWSKLVAVEHFNSQEISIPITNGNYIAKQAASSPGGQQYYRLFDGGHTEPYKTRWLTYENYEISYNMILFS